MAKKLLDDAVTRAEDDSWSFHCPGVAGSMCGDPSGPPFSSTGWPTKALAATRGQQHFDDHKLGAEIRAAVEAARAEVPDDPESVDEAAVREKAIKASAYSVQPDLDAFRAEHGLQPHSDGVRAVQIGDLT